MITREVLASQLRDYLQHRIARAALVDWAENAMMDEEFDDRDLDTIRDITSRLGLADVRGFGHLGGLRNIPRSPWVPG